MCSKKIKDNIEMSSFENNKDFFSRRLDIISLVKLYDELDNFRDLIFETEHKVLLKELSAARIGLYENYSLTKESALEIITKRERRLNIDENIIKLINALEVKI